MYAIVNIQGKQYKVRKNDVIEVERLNAKEKDKINFNDVLLCSNGTESLIGQPYLKDVKVEVEVYGETKGKKTIAFKFKRRKGYQHKVGHRQKYTMLKILNIEAPISAKIPEKKIEKPKAEKPKVAKPKAAATHRVTKSKVRARRAVLQPKSAKK